MSLVQGGSISGIHLNKGIIQKGIAFGILNDFWDISKGGEIGVINICRFNPNKAIQIGFINIINNKINGKCLQIGLFNITSHGLQIGLLNYNEEARFFKILPILNYSKDPTKKYKTI